MQLAYVLGQQGRPADAIERLEPLVMGELSDIGVAAVATNNWVVESYAAGEGAQEVQVVMQAAEDGEGVAIDAHSIHTPFSSCLHYREACPHKNRNVGGS